MKLNIDEKELEKAIIKKAAELLVTEKRTMFSGTSWDVQKIAEKIVYESPEIRKIIENKVKECVNDSDFMSHALERILFDNFKKQEDDD